MSLWALIFLYPFTAAEWDPTEDKLSKLIIESGGDYDGNSSTVCGRREVVGYFVTEQAAKKCGAATWDLYTDFLSWSVEEVEVTA